MEQLAANIQQGEQNVFIKAVDLFETCIPGVILHLFRRCLRMSNI